MKVSSRAGAPGSRDADGHPSVRPWFQDDFPGDI